MGTFGKWLTGLIILGIAALILNLFTPWGAKANSKSMGMSVETALNKAGFGTLNTDMVGNVAKLSGTLPSKEAKTAALAAAENAQCEKCGDREAGKRWHEVDGSNVNVVKPVVTVDPYTLTGVKTDTGVVLNGYVRDEAARSSLLASAEALFPGQVTDNKIKFAQGAPNADWLNVAQSNLSGLSKLDSGEFLMENTSSVLRGRAATTDVRTDVINTMNALSTGYNGATNISVPQAAAMNTGQIKSATICQELFESLKGDNKINFANNRDELTGVGSFTLLDTLASAAQQCSTFRVNVEGHTDSVGDEAYNLDLSRRRAEAVVAYLVSHGVNVDNVDGGGYGESRPVASNDTASGKAANRRIEFKVTRSK